MAHGICLQRSADGDTAIWRLSLHDSGGGHLTGAWVLPDGDEQIPVITADSTVLQDPGPVIEELRGTLRGWQADLQAAFEEYQATKPALGPLGARSWPAVPGQVQLPSSDDRPAVAGQVLADALLLDALLQAWDDTEQQRASTADTLRSRRASVSQKAADTGLTDRQRDRAAADLAACNNALAGSLGAIPTHPIDALTQQ